MSKISKLFVAVLASFVLSNCSSNSSTGGGGNEPPAVDPIVTSVTVSPATKTIDLYTSSSFTLTATVIGTNNPSKQVTWTSDSNIAYVDQSGRVTCSDTGTAHITATSVFDTSKSGTCTLTVVDTTPTPTEKALPCKPYFAPEYDGKIMYFNRNSLEVDGFDIYIFPTGDMSQAVCHSHPNYHSYEYLQDGESAYIITRGGANYLDSDPSYVISYDRSMTKFETPKLTLTEYKDSDRVIATYETVETDEHFDDIFRSKIEVGYGSTSNIMEWYDFSSSVSNQDSIPDNTELYIRKAPTSQDSGIQASDWSDPIVFKHCHHESYKSTNLKFPTCEYAGHRRLYTCSNCGAHSDDNYKYYFGAYVETTDWEEIDAHYKKLEHKQVTEYLFDEHSHWEITYCPNCGDYEISHEKHSHEMVNGVCTVCGYSSQNKNVTSMSVGDFNVGTAGTTKMKFGVEYEEQLSNVSAQNSNICNFIILARGRGACSFSKDTLKYTEVSKTGTKGYTISVEWNVFAPFQDCESVDFVIISRNGVIYNYQHLFCGLVENIVMEQKQYNVAIGSSVQMEYSLGDKVPYVKDALIWTSSNESVATVDKNGNVKGLSIGTTTISLTSNPRFTYGDQTLSASAAVTVKESYLPNRIEVIDDTLITTKNPYQLDAKLEPKGSKANLTYQSSDTSVATVSSSGVVTGLKAGVAEITTTSSNGLTAKTTIHVEKYDIVSKTQLNTDYYQYSQSLDSGTYLVNKGQTSLLVIPVSFTDSPSELIIDRYDEVTRTIDSYNEATVIEDLNNIYFGDPKETGMMSVKAFYEAESNYQLEINGTVADWYNAPVASSSITTLEQVYQLGKDALDNYREQNRVGGELPDLKEFDNNSDGYIDGVVIAYAYPPTMHNGWGYPWNSAYGIDTINEMMWSYILPMPHNWSGVDSPNVNFPSMPASMQWVSLDALRGATSEATYTGFSSHFSSYLQEPGTAIHETGHMFGLPDYYDTDSHNDTWHYINANLTGFYTMQEGNEGRHDPYSLISLGWVDPYVISEECTIELNKGDVALLSPNGLSSNSPFDEYMLVDLWSYGGIDVINEYNSDMLSAIKPGVRIWHVDSRLSGNNFIADNNFSTQYNQLMLMRADAAIDEGAYEAKHAEMNGTLYYDDPQTGDTKCSVGYNTYSKEMNYNSLFRAGESFSAAKYPKAFFTDGTFDNGQEFNWIITVISVNKDRAIVNFKRA